MPYSSTSQLPGYIRRRSKAEQEKWMSVWNDTFDKTGSERKAFLKANGAIGAAENSEGVLVFHHFADSFPDWDAAGRYTVEVMRTGTWEHPDYGTVEITSQGIATLIRNFRMSTRKLPLDYNHGMDYGSTPEETLAAGWFVDLWIETMAGAKLEPDEAAKYDGGVLFVRALVEVTERANEYIKRGEFKFFSPTFAPEYTNKETGLPQGMTLLRGAMTNTPFFDGMEPFKQAASERLTNALKLGLTITGGTMDPEIDAVATLTGVPVLNVAVIFQQESAIGPAEVMRQLAALLPAARGAEHNIDLIGQAAPKLLARFKAYAPNHPANAPATPPHQDIPGRHAEATGPATQRFEEAVEKEQKERGISYTEAAIAVSRRHPELEAASYVERMTLTLKPAPTLATLTEWYAAQAARATAAPASPSRTMSTRLAEEFEKLRTANPSWTFDQIMDAMKASNPTLCIEWRNQSHIDGLQLAAQRGTMTP